MKNAPSAENFHPPPLPKGLRSPSPCFIVQSLISITIKIVRVLYIIHSHKKNLTSNICIWFLSDLMVEFETIASIMCSKGPNIFQTIIIHSFPRSESSYCAGQVIPGKNKLRILGFGKKDLGLDFKTWIKHMESHYTMANCSNARQIHPKLDLLLILLLVKREELNRRPPRSFCTCAIMNQTH